MVALGFLLAYGFQFTVVHPYVDTRACVAQLPDPLFAVLPFDGRWYRVSHELFYLATVVILAALLWQAARGDHWPMLRFALGISLQVPMRSLTMVLLPLCRATVPAGQAPRTSVPSVDLGFTELPWLPWATNDLMFSGHVCEFLILYFAVRRTWPRPALVGLAVFQLVQAVALIATRGHYTIDIVVAIPFAVLADGLSVALLGGLAALGERKSRAARPQDLAVARVAAVAGPGLAPPAIEALHAGPGPGVAQETQVVEAHVAAGGGPLPRPSS